MRILASVHLYPPDHLAGAEMMLHKILKFMQSKGHEVKVLINQASHYKIERNYAYDGVDVFPPGKDIVLDLYRWSDVVFTHLDCTNWSLNMAQMFKKPCFHLVHNTYKRPEVELAERQYIVYNSDAAKDKIGYRHESIVIHPPVDWREYETEPGDSITLINLNENKGADIFFRLAEMMPDRKFIGVMGSYDGQMKGKMLEYKEYAVQAAEVLFREVTKTDETPKNVELWGKQTDIRNVYKRTRILLMPSRYESYGRTAIEAMSSGIPVICTSTFGLLESCGSAGIYVQQRDNLDEWVKQIKKLDSKKAYEEASRKAKERAKQLDPGKELNELESWVREKRSQHKW